jgi:hypothetical protein
MTLVVCRAEGHRPGDWNPDDLDVLDDGRKVGRIYRINAAREIWGWVVSFQLTGCRSYGSYGDAPTRDDAMAAFRAEYKRWLAQGDGHRELI